MEQQYRDRIAREFVNCVTDTIQRLNNAETNRPFHAALLSEDALFWSRFERSFSTSFGQRVIEEVSLIVALSSGATNVQKQKTTYLNIDQNHSNAIEDHLRSIRNNTNRNRRNFNNETNEVRLVVPSGNEIQKRIISDLYWERNGIEHFLSIKTVKPNIDQTVEAKRDLMSIAIVKPNSRVYFGLYYNPYGESKSTYNHNPPMNIFNFHEDEVVLIGKEYWDTLGGIGCYEEVIEIAREIGIHTIAAIERLNQQR